MKVWMMVVGATVLLAEGQLSDQERLEYALAQRDLAAAQVALLATPAYQQMRSAQEAETAIASKLKQRCQAAGKDFNQQAISCVERKEEKK